jgi:hypothetical protein
MKIFISQPMRSRSDKAILQERAEIMDALANVDNKAEEIKSFIPGKNDPLESLGTSISMMAQANQVIFAPGWKKARGCRIEYLIAVEYGKDILYFHEDGTINEDSK